MGGCCIVFDIGRMLFEFCINYLNIEKKNVRFVFNISCFLLVSWYFQHLKKNWWGGGLTIFFLEKQFFLISFHLYMLFSTLKNI